MHHLLIAVALLAAVGLNLIFISFSDEPSAALTFSLLSYFIMLLLSGSAGSYVPDMEDFTGFLGPLVRNGTQGFVSRLLLAYSVPAVLLLLVAFLPDLDDPLAPNATVQLGSTFAVLWLLMSLALVGVVQGFLWPHSGVFQAVIVGGLVVATQGLLSWAKVDANWPYTPGWYGCPFASSEHGLGYYYARSAASNREEFRRLPEKRVRPMWWT